MNSRPLLILGVLGGCGSFVTDPAATGVSVVPSPGVYEAPQTLRITNRTTAPMRCELAASSLCPSEGLPAEVQLDSGDSWEATVRCVVLDVACMFADDPEPATPQRVWGWSVLPGIDE